MPKEQQFEIEMATEDDWPWIVQGQIEIAWARLSLEGQASADRKALEQRVRGRVASLREDEGFPNVAFVAKVSDAQPAGFVWVAKDHNDATGQLEAVLLNQYVAEPYRGQGLGRRLMETAEDWAERQDLTRIALSVGANNRIGQKLYESLGYQVETLRLVKTLQDEEEDEGLLLSNV